MLSVSEQHHPTWTPGETRGSSGGKGRVLAVLLVRWAALMPIQGHLIYCAIWAKVSHCQPFQEATASRAFYPASSLPSVSQWKRCWGHLSYRSHKAALSPGTTSRTRLLLSDCFTWPALNEQGSEKCHQNKFSWQPLYTPYTLCMWTYCTIPLPTPEVTIYQILTGKTNQNGHFQDRFPGWSSSCQLTTRFLDLCTIQD